MESKHFLWKLMFFDKIYQVKNLLGIPLHVGPYTDYMPPKPWLKADE